MKVASALATSELLHSDCFSLGGNICSQQEVAHRVLKLFLFFSLEKIPYQSGGHYECVFETDPQLKKTIEVKSKLIELRSHVF